MLPGYSRAVVYPSGLENKRPAWRIPHWTGPIRGSRRENTLSRPLQRRVTEHHADDAAQRGVGVGSTSGGPLADRSTVEPVAWLAHQEELRRFVLGVTRNADLTADVLQNTFAKAVEQAGGVSPGSFKAWLFRVAYNEAMLHHRRKATGERVVRRLAWEEANDEDSPGDCLARKELVDAVREVLQTLPAAQQEVVRRRMYDQQKFAEIAAELKLPLGTVLSRMQLAIKKLRLALGSHMDH